MIPAAGGDPLRVFLGSEGKGLRDRDLRREGVVVGEGRLLSERIAARLPLLAVLAEPSAAAEAEALAAGRCPVAVLPAAALEAVAGYPFHRGLLVAAERPPLPPPPLSLPLACSRLLVLPEPTDPENLGSLVRSAAALGWDAVVLGPGACDPFGRRALRCSMGATLSLPLWECGAEDFSLMAESGGWTAAAAELAPGALAAGTPEAAAILRADRLALMFGNERDGIPETWRALRAASVAVPQARESRDGVDSLNVAAAAAILLWEGRRP